MPDRPKGKSGVPGRRLSWLTLPGGSLGNRETKDTWALASPIEGQELNYPQSSRDRSYTAPPTPSATVNQSASSSPSSSRPSTPLHFRPLYSRRSSSSTNVLTHQPPQLDQKASQLLLNALERTNSLTDKSKSESRGSGSFGRMSLSSVMGGLSALSFSRSSTDDTERGRSLQSNKGKGKARSSSLSMSASQDEVTDMESDSRARSQSPFRLRRMRARDPSPAVGALAQSDVESDTESTRRSIRPRSAFIGSPLSDDDSGSETENDNDSDDSWAQEDHFDFETERNTERNALVPAERVDAAQEEFADPLGEGVNVVVPPEPYFPSTLNSSHSKRKNSKKHHDLLPLNTSRPIFQRDRCTITITHGNPTQVLEENGRRPRRYVVASDLSEESRYAVEWGIGTVLRDGDEMLLVTVVENENKIDPPTMNAVDRAMKLRNQQERQALAYILVRQVTGLLQRTRLNITVACQSWHAKNHRHMLLDIVDYFQPTMLIVGSRGLGQLKGCVDEQRLSQRCIDLAARSILLGSTSHYLIQKCAVPVMVARRRLKRPPRRNAHLAPHRARVSLAEAGIDRVAPKVDHDVQVMRDEIERDDERRDGAAEEQNEEDPDTEVEPDTLLGRKVAGE
ncbi:hypothetical protein OE88DRAFT_1400663 [Heliocybe sulcata]|uniref:UspA domain-containing protein n=1 Tax=Heliocybe sulcata TaxID=5364 RepID=A0A5C3N6G5_9AGAM|nr:hypothetical protein OE88DRAFT_1400663 [Heliocybe sulcata]